MKVIRVRIEDDLLEFLYRKIGKGRISGFIRKAIRYYINNVYSKDNSPTHS